MPGSLDMSSRASKATCREAYCGDFSQQLVIPLLTIKIFIPGAAFQGGMIDWVWFFRF